MRKVTTRRRTGIAACAAGRLSIDTETTSTDPMRAELVGISLAVEPGRACYLPLGHRLAPGQVQADRAEVLALLAPILADPTIAKLGQNLKYDLTVLARAGVAMQGVEFDCMVASYLLNPGKTSHGLAAIAAEYLGRSVISYEQATGGKNKSFADTPLDIATTYPAEDADVALHAALKLGPLLKNAKLDKLFRELEMPLVPLLSRLEMNGVGLDVDGLHALSKEMEGQLRRSEEICHQLAGHPFNINSPPQLGKVLFEELNLPSQGRTGKTKNYSTAADVLEALAVEYPIARKVLDYRQLTKLKGTYVDALPQLIDPSTGRVHTTFNPAGAATGRLSSSNPNLQNIPVRTELGREIRAAFVPAEGWTLLVADYSQIELRLLAHYSRDAVLVDAFRNNEDIHTRTASEVFNVAPLMVTPEMRRNAKAVNFGIVYGQTSFGLAAQLGISREEADHYIKSYFARYAGVKRWIELVIEQVRASGATATLYGRRRPIPDIASKNPNARAFAERTAVNTPLQGTAADLIKLAMIAIDKELAARKMQTRMLLQVHDELVLECPGWELDEAAALVKRLMEGVAKLEVPLLAETGSGANWRDAK